MHQVLLIKVIITLHIEGKVWRFHTYIQTVYELIQVTGMPSTWKHLAFLCARNVQFLPIELQNPSMFWNTQIVVVNHNYPSGLYDHESYSSQLGVVANSYRSSMWKAEAQGNSFYIVNSVSDTKHLRAASQEGIHASCCSRKRSWLGRSYTLGESTIVVLLIGHLSTCIQHLYW